MEITKKIILNTNNDKPNSRIIIKQGCIDTITLIVTINDKGGVLELPQGTTAKIRMLKPDKKQVLNDCTVSGNNVLVDITQQMQAVAGEGQCEVILFNGAKTFTTVTFPITIEPNVHDDSQIESTPEYNTLINSLIRIEGAIPQAEEAYRIAQEAQEFIDDLQDRVESGEFKGEKGDKGDPGEKGEKGDPGFSPTISINTDTDTTYKLDITDINGTFTTPNLKGADGTGTGDMLVSVYDPQGKATDIFAYTDTKIDEVSLQLANKVDRSEIYKIYGVQIDLTNSNPETAVTYTDDAVGMSPGSAWNSMPIFKDIKPCVLKNGVVQYYLDPNDLTKKADGTSADITSGNDGDVMIEIPKTGFLISTVGNALTVKVTEDPNNPNFKYYAHSRATEGDRSKLYIGAYLGWNDGDKLRSLSGKTPTANQTIGTFRTQAQANGSGYDLVSFYPLTLLQCLYLIKYKNLDSQSALGRGYVDGNSAVVATGGTNAKGIDFGETSGKQQMCFLNIEDMWGNLRWFIDGFFSPSRNMLTAFTDFNDTGSGYTNRGRGATSDIGNYMSKPQGTTEAGFIVKEVSGSVTTHFTDYVNLYASRFPVFGGHWNNGSYAGAFCLRVVHFASDSYSDLGGRLMYL